MTECIHKFDIQHLQPHPSEEHTQIVGNYGGTESKYIRPLSFWMLSLLPPMMIVHLAVESIDNLPFFHRGTKIAFNLQGLHRFHFVCDRPLAFSVVI